MKSTITAKNQAFLKSVFETVEEWADPLLCVNDCRMAFFSAMRGKLKPDVAGADNDNPHLISRHSFQ